MILRQHYLTRGDSVQPWLRDGHSLGHNDAALFPDQEEAVLLQGGGSALQSTVGVPGDELAGAGDRPTGEVGRAAAAALTASQQPQELELSRLQLNTTGEAGAGSPAAAVVEGEGNDAQTAQEDVVGLMVRLLLLYREILLGCVQVFLYIC
jgi:hypothetical protein